MSYWNLRRLTVSALIFPALFIHAMDFDDDGISDLTVYHAEEGEWYVFSSASNQLIKTTLGGPDFQPVIGDFDNDGVNDYATYRASDGRWTIRQSSNNALLTYTLGSVDEAPVAADYDGDGITDMAVYKRANGQWRIRQSSTQTIRTESFGWPEAKAVPADFDGDGKADLAVFHRATGNWYIFGSTSGFRLENFGFPAVRAVPADYDGDGKADLAVYDRNTGTWFIFGSMTGFRMVNWGFNRARAIPGDYDGDGKADLAVYERDFGRWYIWRSLSNSSKIVGWGWNQATPLAPYRNGGIEGLVILSFGDSITYGTSSACDCPLTGYPALLKRVLGPALGGHFDTVNAGVPGETTSEGRARLNAWLAKEKPELLILMEGTNDHFFNTPPSIIENNLRAMIQQARAAGAHVILATIPPVITNEFRDRSAQAQRIQQFNPRIYTIGASLGVPVAPIFEAITSVPNWQNTLIDQPTANHPNDAGYRIVANTFMNTIRTAIQNGQLY